jgi:very-short-patch-repair endonuclease
MPNELPDDGVLLRVDAVRRYGDAYVRRMLARGVWARPDPRVVVTHNGPLTWRQHVWVAVLAAPARSVAAGLTALHLEGFTGFDLLPVHVLIPARGRRPANGLAVWHRSEVLPDHHVAPRLPPRTTRARSLVDAASWADTDRQARAIVLSVVRQRLVTVQAAFQALDVRLVTRRQKTIAEALHDAAGGIQSLPEQDFDRLLRRGGLPRPVRQRVLVRVSGTVYLDADYDEYALTVEIDGAPHTDVEAGEADATREHALVITGRRVLRFSAWQVRHRPRYVARVIAEALRSGGWTGHPTPWVSEAA